MTLSMLILGLFLLIHACLWALCDVFGISNAVLRHKPHKIQELCDIISPRLVELAGTPELVDYVIEVSSCEPEIVDNMEIYNRLFPFALDKFQKQSLDCILKDQNVILSSPTGSGKTAAIEMAAWKSFMKNQCLIYTAPLKALCNQKYNDFSTKFGRDRVGLITGDLCFNHGSPLIVMTTEVLRNILYENNSLSRLSGVSTICFDEFHYMNDVERGSVWEECIVACPPWSQILALSATIRNIDEIGGWISSIHKSTATIVSSVRPVPLQYFFFTGKKLLPLFKSIDSGPGAKSGVQNAGSKLNMDLKSRPMGNNRKPSKYNSRMIPLAKLTDLLNNSSSLPAIVFIFSRYGCEANAQALVKSGVHLLNETQKLIVANAIERFRERCPDAPIKSSHLQMLHHGIGIHHAGLLPQWKAVIEELFVMNCLPLLLATETLAAGVNLPARTTVISKGYRMIGSLKKMLTTSQLLQMAGRAGRRGWDTIGNVVFLKDDNYPVEKVHSTLLSLPDEIKSRFHPSYGIICKLYQSNKTFSECGNLLSRSFGTYISHRRTSNIHEKVKIEDGIHIYSNIDNSISQNNSNKGKSKTKNGDYVWQLLRNMTSILVEFGALSGTNVTSLGRLIGSLTCENELQLACMLSMPLIETLSVIELGAVVSSVVMDRGAMIGKPFALPISSKDVDSDEEIHEDVDEHDDEDIEEIDYGSSASMNLLKLWKPLKKLVLKIAHRQDFYGMDHMKMTLDASMSSIVMMWLMNDCAWKDLISFFSEYEQGDIFRHLKRVQDVLQQIADSNEVALALKQVAQDAVHRMEKFPLSDDSMV